MAEWLIIRLTGAETPTFMVADGDGRQVEAARSGTLAEASQRSAGRRVCLVVPGSDVLLTDAEVPPRATGARLAQVVPFALEEQLAEDIDNLQFALGRRDANATRIPVAVVSRALLDGWLAQLRAARLEPDAIQADSTLLPDNPGQAIALLDSDSILVRPAGGQATTLPLAALPEALELLLPATDGAAAPAGLAGGGLVVYASREQWQQYQAPFEALRGRLERLSVQLLADGPLPFLARSLTQPAAINLLQGSYTPAAATSLGWKAWRTAAALFAGLLVLHGVGNMAQLAALKKAERRLDTETASLVRQSLPGVTDTRNARHIVEAKLRLAQGATDSSGLLAMLAAVSQARATAPGTTVQSLSYRDGSLEMQVNGTGADALDHISQQLRANGWQADLTSTNTAGSAYQGHILVKPR